jgi:uncharacterized protein
MKLSHRSIHLLASILLGSAMLGGCAVDATSADGQNVIERHRERYASFEIFQDDAGEYRFRLKAANGEIILASEGYVSKSGAENGVESVKTHGVDLGYYEVRQADNEVQYYFVLKAANHEIIGVSEMYASKSNAERGTETVRDNVAKLLRHETGVQGGAGFELFRDAAAEYRFNLKAANHEVVLSSEGYQDLGGALHGIDSVRDNGRDVENYEIREAQDGSFYFVLKAANHEIIGMSEMYVSNSNAERGAQGVADLLYSERVADPK